MAFDKSALQSVMEIERQHINEDLARIDALDSFFAGREFPDGAMWLPNKWDIRWHSIAVSVPPVDGRQWRGLDGTAGIIYRLRKYFGVAKLKREIDDSYGTVTFRGYSEIGGENYYVKIDVGSQLPESCTLVEEEVTETVTRKKYHTVCA